MSGKYDYIVTHGSFNAYNLKLAVYNHFVKLDWMLPDAKLKYDQKCLKKGVKVMGLGQWGKKKCCKMFSLAANQTCGFSKTDYKS